MFAGAFVGALANCLGEIAGAHGTEATRSVRDGTEPGFHDFVIAI